MVRLLTVLFLTAFFSDQTIAALKLKFKDGTELNGAEIYVPSIPNSRGNPDHRGVILMFQNKLYIHHFPYRSPLKITKVIDDGIDDGRYKTVEVMEELEHYHPRSSPLDSSPRELSYSCTPSRIAFFHFDRSSLDVLYKAVSSHARIPKPNQKNALQAIHAAYYATPNPTYYNTPRHSKIWQAEADRDLARYLSKVFYGKWFEQPDLAPPEFQKLLWPRRQVAP